MTAHGADVIVVGAGPAGVSTAWHLARAGANVLVLDRARFPREKPCAEYLSPQASRVLSSMGVLSACERAGAAQLSGMVIRAPNGSYIRGHFASSHGFHGFRDRGLALRRVVFDQLLLDHARTAGVRVEEGVRVTGLIRGAHGAVRGVLTIEPGGAPRQREAGIVVGADGLRSIVGRRVGLTRFGRFPRRLALIAHYEGVRDMHDYGEMHVERDGYAGLADVGDGITNVAVVVPIRHAGAITGNATAFFDRWLAVRPHLAPRLARARRISTVKVTGPFAQHARRAWARGAALVGDAADFFDPFTGEGIYAALRGGELLAPSLIDALAAPNERAECDALENYDALRRAEFGGKWKVERLVGMAVAFPRLMNRAAHALSQRKDMADLFVGVAGDFVPPEQVLAPRYLGALLLGPSLWPTPPSGGGEPIITDEPPPIDGQTAERKPTTDDEHTLATS